MLKLEDSSRDTAEVVDLLVQEVGESCRAIELGDGYLAAVINPCLGPEEERVVRLLLAAPDLAALIRRMAESAADTGLRREAETLLKRIT